MGQKGESLWGMNYYQCTRCGAIMSFKDEFELDDDIYASIYCNKCGNTHALCLYEKENFYIYVDSFLDERYFNYTKVNNTKL